MINLEQFIIDDVSAEFCILLKYSLYYGNHRERFASQRIVFIILKELLRRLVPFMPYTTDELYIELKRIINSERLPEYLMMIDPCSLPLHWQNSEIQYIDEISCSLKRYLNKVVVTDLRICNEIGHLEVDLNFNKSRILERRLENLCEHWNTTLELALRALLQCAKCTISIQDQTIGDVSDDSRPHLTFVFDQQTGNNTIDLLVSKTTMLKCIRCRRLSIEKERQNTFANTKEVNYTCSQCVSSLSN
ncbi:hypothetical protein GJ496_002637 [Pomphorhynchus laevis]|nr:hypothetical protein GJ496_002637 [Pomphorhynchus laevis]